MGDGVHRMGYHAELLAGRYLWFASVAAGQNQRPDDRLLLFGQAGQRATPPGESAYASRYPGADARDDFAVRHFDDRAL